MHTLLSKKAKGTSSEEDVQVPDSHSSPLSPTVAGFLQEKPGGLSLAEVFGYYGSSEFNIMALVRKLVPENDSPEATDIPISTETSVEVRKTLDMMLSRPILDFLVRYFVTTVNWIDQVMYPPWFLRQYQRWWKLDQLSSVADIEFTILFLRVCHYASQFLPSPTYTIDSIKGVCLADIRKSCEVAINALAPICIRLDPRGSLIRVQHTAFAGLDSMCMGRMNAFWEQLSYATRVAQQIGLHSETMTWSSSADELDKEMRRRTFCNLYIWDSCLSKRLERIPFLSDGLSAHVMPQMHLRPDIDVRADAPDLFTERVLRAQLAQFWRSHSPTKGLEYDPMGAEERYESFCSTFLASMPSVFALQPDKQWDERLPTLPMQRQLLHIAIFESLCWNFTPTLLQQADQDRQLLGYKRILILHNKQALAVAGLNLLQSVSALHAMMGGSHTRFASIIVPIFEAAVPLLCLCADESFPGDTGGGRSHTLKTDPLGASITHLSRAGCMQAARDALSRLQTLAEVSDLAEVGARTLSRLMERVNSSSPVAGNFGSSHRAADAVMQLSEPWSCNQLQEYDVEGFQGQSLLNNDLYTNVNWNWEEMMRDLTGSIEVEDIGSYH
ncbi:MAG: hypothetical protein Q9192_005097 [Flavoplaca navasiana]